MLLRKNINLREEKQGEKANPTRNISNCEPRSNPVNRGSFYLPFNSCYILTFFKTKDGKNDENTKNLNMVVGYERKGKGSDK